VFAGREYLAGDRFTVADAYGFTIVGWAPMLGMSLKAYPNLQAWLARIAARPAVHAALVAEGLAKH
jgi:glutathione S-transferase